MAAGGLLRIAGPGEMIEVVATVPLWVRLWGSVAGAARALSRDLDPGHSVEIQSRAGLAWRIAVGLPLQEVWR